MGKARRSFSSRQALVVAGAVALWLALVSCGRSGGTPALPPEQRPSTWATPIERPGLPNLHRVSDTLYRGAQPEADGFQELKKLGVKTVVNLRFDHSDRDLLGDAGLGYIEIPMTTLHMEDEDMVRFLRIVTDPARAPVFVHCQYGADRTGVACALYRVAVQGWTVQEAAREMEQGGNNFHAVWLDDYFKDLNIKDIRKRAGMSAGTGAEPVQAPALEPQTTSKGPQ